MSGVSPYVVISYLVIAAGAMGWHMVSEHYVHLVWLRAADPETKVPDVSQDSWWHAMAHWKRLGAHAVMAGTAIVAGLAWQLSPYAIAAFTVLGVITLVLVLVRRADHPGLREHVHSREAGTTEGNPSLCRRPGSAGSSSSSSSCGFSITRRMRGRPSATRRTT